MENVRQELINYIKNKGVKMRFIAEKTGINETLLSRFKNNKRDLSKNNYNILKEFLSNNN